MTWHIISQRNGGGFQIKAQADLDASTDYLVATHHDEASALEGIERAQLLERQLRPLWLAAIEHEQRVKNEMLSAVYTAAKPQNPSEGETENGL